MRIIKRLAKCSGDYERIINDNNNNNNLRWLARQPRHTQHQGNARKHSLANWQVAVDAGKN